MNVARVDKRRRAPIIAATVMVVMMLVVLGVFCWGAIVDPILLPLVLFIMAFPLVIIAGVLLALKQRMKEIEGGEEDAASKY